MVIHNSQVIRSISCISSYTFRLIYRAIFRLVFGLVKARTIVHTNHRLGTAGRTVHTHTHTHTRTHTPQVQNYAAKHRPSTRQNICEPLRVISVKHSSVLPDDGSHKIRNMSE